MKKLNEEIDQLLDEMAPPAILNGKALKVGTVLLSTKDRSKHTITKIDPHTNELTLKPLLSGKEFKTPFEDAKDKYVIKKD